MSSTLWSMSRNHEENCTPKWHRGALRLAACLLLSYGLAACALAEPYRWSGIDRIVAVSDPHGAFDALVDTLDAAEVIDDQQQWSGGKTHLVITGDLLDRGPDSRKIMDLVMRLEQESAAAGGMVHLTLGNHEVMNLVGDLRYVSESEYQAFAEEETADEREQWFQKYRAAHALDAEQLADVVLLREEFDNGRPPGFFAHRQAFSSEGKYGRWLLEKPILVVVNDTAFVHGGLPPLVAELGLDELNNQLQAQVRDYIREIEVLVDAGFIDPAVNFYDHRAVAEAHAADVTLAPDIQSALEAILILNDASVHDAAGPLWYRGAVGCSALTESDVLADSLAAIGAQRVVIGHTPTVTRRILQKFDGRVIEIDTGMLRSSYHGSGNALVIGGEKLSVVNQAGSSPLEVDSHPRRVGMRNGNLSAALLEQVLTSGQLISTDIDAADRKIVELRLDGITIDALFVPGNRKKSVNTELAAYRLDRLIGLDMVPVTAAREIDGERGTLQFLPDDTRDESYRAANGQGNSAWCPLQRQWNSMYIFDALVFNEGRAPSNMSYSPENWQLLLTGHPNSFGTKRGRPEYLANVEFHLTDAWEEALTSLTNDTLTQQLGDVLDKRRIAALGKRRDLLLKEAAESR